MLACMYVIIFLKVFFETTITFKGYLVNINQHSGGGWKTKSSLFVAVKDTCIMVDPGYPEFNESLFLCPHT